MKLQTRALWTISLLILLNSFIGAQPSRTFSYIKFTSRDGLPGTVYSMTQDRSHFIWMGTNNGLYRYDGSYFTEVGLDHGIDSRIITDLHLLNDSTLLIYGKQPFGLYIINPIEDVHKINAGKLLLNRAILFISLNSDGAVIGDTYGLYSIDRDLQKTPYPFSLPPNNSLKSYLRTNMHYLSLKGEALALSPLGKAINLKDLPDVAFEEILGIASNSDSVLWVHTKKGFYEMKSSGSRFLPLRWAKENINALHYKIDGLGRIWFSSLEEELFLYDPHIRQLSEISTALNIEKDQVTSINNDHRGNIWIGTTSQGLLYVPVGITQNYSETDGLTGRDIIDISKWSENAYYLATNNGINLMIRDSAFIHPLKNTVVKGSCAKNETNLYDHHYAHMVSHFKNSIIYSADLSPLTCKSRWLEKEVHITQGTATYQLHKDTLVIGGWSGVRKVILSDNELELISYCKGRIGKTHGITQFQDQLWLATDYGLFMVPPSLSEFIPVTFTHLFPNMKVDPVCRDIINQGDSILWVATNRGILKYGNGKWQTLENPEFSQDNYRSLSLDSKSRLWIASNRGLYRYNGESVRFFGKETGLISEDINKLQYISESNDLLVGTPNGLSIIDIDILDQNAPKKPSLTINLLQANDSVILNPVKVDLHRSYKNLKIDYNLTEFITPGKIIYSYRLKGAHEDWHLSDNGTSEYLGLEPNHYTFEVKAKVPGSDWGEVSTATILINPPFWKTPGFIVFALLSFLLLVFTSTWLWTKNVRREEQMKRATLQKVNLLEQQAISSTMNPHFIFNSLNSIQYFISSMPQPSRQAIDYIADFSRLIRENMEASQYRTVKLKQELERLELYLKLEKERLNEHLDYTIDISPRVPADEINIPSMLLIPFAENAIWHGIIPSHQKGLLLVKIEILSGFLKIIFQDNGIGLNTSKSNDHTSMGVALSRDRLKLLAEANEIKVKNRKDGQGVIVTILMYLNHSSQK